jgi:hypothetical protein
VATYVIAMLSGACWHKLLRDWNDRVIRRRTKRAESEPIDLDRWNSDGGHDH